MIMCVLEEKQNVQKLLTSYIILLKKANCHCNKIFKAKMGHKILSSDSHLCLVVVYKHHAHLQIMLTCVLN